MKSVLLLQLDGKLPNIALMRIAAHHRKLGDKVELRQAFTLRTIEPPYWEKRPDAVYASLIFEWSRPIAKRLLEIYPHAVIGGTGIEETTSLEAIGINTTEQDYDLYPKYRFSIGYTQRGCRLKCGFCRVPRDEGKVRKISSAMLIWRGKPHPKCLCLLDNDFFGQGEWPDDMAAIREGGFKVCFNQGINIRMIDREHAESIASVHYSDDQFKTRRLYTAWDNAKDEDRLFRGLELLRSAGVKPDNIMVYMLIGYWHGPKLNASDFYRQDRLREFGCRPYPMAYAPTEELKGFQRWVIGAYDKRVSWERWERARYEPRNLTGNGNLFDEHQEEPTP